MVENKKAHFSYKFIFILANYTKDNDRDKERKILMVENRRACFFLNSFFF